VCVGTSVRVGTSMVGHGEGSVMGVRGGVLSDDGSLDDLLDGMDRVGLGNVDSTGYIDGVRPLHVLLDNDLPLDGDGDVHLNVIGDTVHLELGLDDGPLGSHDGVGADGSEDPLLGDGVSRSGALVRGCGGDDEGNVASIWEDRLGNREGGLGSLGGLSDVGVGLLRVERRACDVELASDLDLLGSDLDGAMSDDAVLDLVGLVGWSLVVGLGHVGVGGSLVHNSGTVEPVLRGGGGAASHQKSGLKNKENLRASVSHFFVLAKPVCLQKCPLRSLCLFGFRVT
jgi:hypothetical protein